MIVDGVIKDRVPVAQESQGDGGRERETRGEQVGKAFHLRPAQHTQAGIKVGDTSPGKVLGQFAQKPFGYQVSVLGTLFWKVQNAWLLSLNLDYNFASTGIGSDFTFTFNFEKSF